MRIVICGLGHVGSVSAACLLEQGHEVIAVDTSAGVCSAIERGHSPVREPLVEEMISEGQSAGRLSVMASPGDCPDVDMAIVCAGTPGHVDGTIDLSHVTSAARELGQAIIRRSPTQAPMSLVFRSTMPPGSMASKILPTIEAAAGELAGDRFEVFYNPDFTREGSAVEDWLHPSRIIIGERRPHTAGPVRELYQTVAAPVFTTTFAAAEFAKYSDNTFHALKVAFANEMGRYALAAGLDPTEISDLFLADTKLNLSAAYLRPGGPFGGPCLSKDVRAIATHFARAGVEAPIIGNILKSNQAHLDFVLAKIETGLPRGARVLLLGLSFKTNTRDLRESPLVTIAELLLARGYTLAIYDPEFSGSSPAETSENPPSTKLAELLVTELSPTTNWDLVIVGKAIPNMATIRSQTSRVMHLDWT